MTSARREHLYELTSNAFQLAGEILFDADNYTDAANCYAVAANAGREARHYDLWACSLVRHAFISLYERQFERAEPLLGLASQIAARGDTSLSTRQWVGSVHAHALAGQGDVTGCLRALELAESVTDLHGDIHNGGWLRSDGSRLAEDVYVALCWTAQIFKRIADPKPAYVAGWDGLPQWQQETDSDIFERIEDALSGS